MNKKGMTLLMLVMYIMVLLVLFGISIKTIIDNKKIGEISEESYKGIIREYVNEFNTTKDYYNLKDELIPSGVIQGSDLIRYIPSISLEHMEYLVIHDGELKYNTQTVSNDLEKEYLEELAKDKIIGEYTPE